MKIYLGADHAGFNYKEQIKKILSNLGYCWEDLGNTNLRPQDDYPDFAQKVAQAVATHSGSRGILICDSGIGMAIVANREPGVRAACVYNIQQAQHSRRDNDSNVLCLGSSYTPKWKLTSIIKTWLNTPISTAKRHRRRVSKIDH